MTATPTLSACGDLLADRGTLFFDGRCTVKAKLPHLRLALESLRTDGIGALLIADPRHDQWLLAARLRSSVKANVIECTGELGLSLHLTMSAGHATGSLHVRVYSEKQREHRIVSIPVGLQRLRSAPGRPSASPAR